MNSVSCCDSCGLSSYTCLWNNYYISRRVAFNRKTLLFRPMATSKGWIDIGLFPLHFYHQLWEFIFINSFNVLFWKFFIFYCVGLKSLVYKWKSLVTDSFKMTVLSSMQWNKFVLKRDRKLGLFFNYFLKSCIQF